MKCIFVGDLEDDAGFVAEVLQENSYWLNVLDDYYYKGFDTDTDYESIVKALTPEKIKAFAQKLLGQGNRVEVIMQP